MYSLNKMNELLKKMLLSEHEKSCDDDQPQYEIDAAFWKSEFECPICFEVLSSSKISYTKFCSPCSGDEAPDAHLAVCGWSPRV